MASPLEAWKRQHAAGERLLGKLLLKFFRAEDARVLESLGDSPTIAGVAAAVQEAKERDAMLAAISPTLIAMMGTGAASVLKQATRRKPKSHKAFDAGAMDDFKLPQRVIDAIAKTFAELEGQDYWLAIQRN